VRLLFVCPDMHTGGAERHWATLVPELKDRGVEVAVLCLAGRGALFGELTARGVSAVCVHMRGRTDLPGLQRALACAKLRPDAVVSRGVSGQLVGSSIARLSRRTAGWSRHARTSALSRRSPPGASTQ
jgi:Glycosyltransferase Family 4